MFEVVYETRKEGSTPYDGTMPQASLVLETKFDTEADAKKAMQGFQGAYEDSWEDTRRGMLFARDPQEAKWHVWYCRPVS